MLFIFEYKVPVARRRSHVVLEVVDEQVVTLNDNFLLSGRGFVDAALGHKRIQGLNDVIFEELALTYIIDKGLQLGALDYLGTFDD